MSRVFLSYRRGDTEGQARALAQALTSRLGHDAVFMDVDGIALGRDFRQVVSERLSSCDVFLALIGPRWLDAVDSSNRRRLDDQGDYVRHEIAAALARDIPVTPILLQGAQMPAADQLPEDIKGLTFRNGFSLGHDKWDSDVDELVSRLRLAPIPASTRSQMRVAVLAVVTLVVAALIAYAVFSPRTFKQEEQRVPASAADGGAAPVEAKPLEAPPVEAKTGVVAADPGPTMGGLEQGINRQGNDLSQDPWAVVRTPEECSNLCLQDSRCRAMTFIYRAEEANQKGSCWLKRLAGEPTSRSDAVSAVKRP